ncbi:hypothetical protein CDAR_218831 [Caerostris darwini]|uniref:Uncharacterized protein n=1 Tax=Caerostris darwini TaxID=1538125 RepID=A0AAV4UGP5_9ARAC|nr:hypothetical protein CDAR_218831 [Caerostris darwini]
MLLNKSVIEECINFERLMQELRNSRPGSKNTDGTEYDLNQVSKSLDSSLSDLPEMIEDKPQRKSYSHQMETKQHLIRSTNKEKTNIFSSKIHHNNSLKCH